MWNQTSVFMKAILLPAHCHCSSVPFSDTQPKALGIYLNHIITGMPWTLIFELYLTIGSVKNSTEILSFLTTALGIRGSL